MTSKEDGLFYEGDADRCAECGFPGHVSVTDSGYDYDFFANFVLDEWADKDARCNQTDCEECPRVA